MLANIAGTKPINNGEAMYRGGKVRTTRYFAVSGGEQGAGLDFVAQTIIVDNWSSQYVYLPTLERWAAPNAIQQIYPTGGISTKNVLFLAPPGLAQGIDNLAPVTVTWIEEAVLYATVRR